MNITFDGGHQDFARRATALGFAGLDKRNQVGDRLFHHPGAFHHLGQEHLAFTKQVADLVHAVHQRPFDHLNRLVSLLAGQFGVVNNVFVDAFNHGMGNAFGDRQFAPGKVFGLFGTTAVALELIGNFQQPIGGVVAAVKHHVFDPLAQFLR